MATDVKRGHRPRADRDVWTEISVRDLDQILNDAKLNLAASRKGELRQLLNDRISQYSRLQGFERKNTTRARIQTFEKIEIAAARLLNILNAEKDTPQLLAYEWEKYSNRLARRGGYEIWKDINPDINDADLVFLIAMNQVPPSQEAQSEVGAMRSAVSNIRELAKSGMKTERARRRGVGKKVESRISGAQYMFVSDLASLFPYFFGIKATATEGGPWLEFLSGVLVRCLGKELSQEGMKDLWMSVRKWRNRWLEDE